MNRTVTNCLSTIKIAYLDNIRDRNPKYTTLMHLCNSLKSVQLAPRIEKIRKEANKEKRDSMKEYLPAFYISAIPEGGRGLSYITRHTGLAQIDLDAVQDFPTTLDKLQSDPYSFILFRSPSGTGIKIIVQIPPLIRKHKEIYETLTYYYKDRYELDIDTKVKALSAVCYASYDPGFHFNFTAKIFNPLKTTHYSLYELHNANRLVDAYNYCLKQKINPTKVYEDWINIAYALAANYSEAGRAMFHRLSSLDSRYSQPEADKVYNSALVNSSSNLDIGIIFNILKKYITS